MTNAIQKSERWTADLLYHSWVRHCLCTLTSLYLSFLNYKVSMLTDKLLGLEESIL